MKTILFSLLLCLGASLKGQDIPHHFNETDSPIFTINPILDPNFTIVDDCKPTQTIKTVNGKLLALCVDGKWESDWGVASKWKNFDQTTAATNFPVSCAGCEGAAKLAEKWNSELGDVPAIQEKQDEECWWTKGRHEDAALYYPCRIKRTVWTCSDPHNYALLTSVDGTNRVCHKVTP